MLSFSYCLLCLVVIWPEHRAVGLCTVLLGERKQETSPTPPGRFSRGTLWRGHAHLHPE